jgi:hypothetical protein
MVWAHRFYATSFNSALPGLATHNGMECRIYNDTANSALRAMTISFGTSMRPSSTIFTTIYDGAGNSFKFSTVLISGGTEVWTDNVSVSFAAVAGQTGLQVFPLGAVSGTSQLCFHYVVDTTITGN